MATRVSKVLSADEINLSDNEFWMRPNDEREGAFETLREEAQLPFYQEYVPPELPIPVGPGYWALTRHADVLEASRNPQIYSSARGATSVIDLPPEMNEFFGGMINMDDPRHGSQRRIVSRAFTPRMLGQIEAQVDERAKAVIDRVIDKGECDFVSEIAAPLPLEIICDMMGIPESQVAMVFEKTNIILGLGDPEFVEAGSNGLVAAMQAGSELAALMKEMAVDRRANPRPDMTTALIEAVGNDEVMTDEELASFFILLVVAGNETTRNAISHGMKALCDNPEQRRRWAEDFEGVADTAVDEIVRWASPVISMRRSLTQDAVLGATEVKAGDKVVLFYNSANRDAAVFTDPHQFDVLRTPNEHVGFGGPGPHYCLGANLARREIKVMFRQIFKRMPDLKISGPPDLLRSSFIHGIKRMPCVFTPGGSGS